MLQGLRCVCRVLCAAGPVDMHGAAPSRGLAAGARRDGHLPPLPHLHALPGCRRCTPPAQGSLNTSQYFRKNCLASPSCSSRCRRCMPPAQGSFSTLQHFSKNCLASPSCSSRCRRCMPPAQGSFSTLQHFRKNCLASPSCSSRMSAMHAVCSR